MKCPRAFLLSAALLLPVGAFAQTGSWRIDPLHSAAHFSVRHLMISTVRGDFAGINGTVRYDPGDLAKSSVTATIDCSTVNTGVAKRDEQMKGEDFFDVKRYPTMKFVSRRVQAASPGRLKIAGDLTIKTTTRPVVLDVEGPSAAVRDAHGNVKIGLGATLRINRKDFGIIWNELLETGEFAVADEVSIQLDIEMIKNAN